MARLLELQRYLLSGIDLAGLSNEASRDRTNIHGEEDFLFVNRSFLTALILLPVEFDIHYRGSSALNLLPTGSVLAGALCEWSRTGDSAPEARDDLIARA